MKTKAALLIFVGALAGLNAHAAVVSYQLTGVFDSPPQVSGSDANSGNPLDTTDWDVLPQIFGASFTLAFDIDDDSQLTGTSGGPFAAFFNFDGAASNISLSVQGSPLASAASGDVRQVLAQASHTWALDAAGTLDGPPLELFDFLNGGFTGFAVGRPFLSLALIDSDQNAYGSGAESLITLSESVFLGDAPVGFITDSLTLFLSSADGADVSIEYNITGTISSISVVPVPAAAWLLVSALGAVFTTKLRRAEAT